MCLLISLFAKAQQIRTLKDCLEEGLQNNYSLRIIHNEEQISKNNATLGNAGYLPTLDFSAGYTGNLDNIETKARATGEITKITESTIRRLMSVLTSTGLFSTGLILVLHTNS